MRNLIPLFTSCVTIYAMWLTGNKDWRGWLVGLLNQIPWLAFIVVFDAWGLLPLTVFLVVMHTRNLRKWRREQRITDLDWTTATSPFADLPIVTDENCPPNTAYLLNTAEISRLIDGHAPTARQCAATIVMRPSVYETLKEGGF